MRIELDDTALYVDTDENSYLFETSDSFHSFVSDILTEKQYQKYTINDTSRIFNVNINKFTNLINELVNANKVSIR